MSPDGGNGVSSWKNICGSEDLLIFFQAELITFKVMIDPPVTFVSIDSPQDSGLEFALALVLCGSPQGASAHPAKLDGRLLEVIQP